MDDEEKAIRDIHADALRARGRVKGVAAHLASLRNLTSPHAGDLAEELAAIGLVFETLANNLKGASRAAALALRADG